VSSRPTDRATHLEDRSDAAPLSESDIRAPVSDDLERVNEALRGIAHDGAMNNPVVERISHVLATPGKRIRPSITLLASRLWGRDSSDAVVNMATAIELLHIATLVHDDTIDRAELRRGHATAAGLWGVEVALVLGDFVFASAARFVCKTGDLRVIGRFSETSSELARGELTELLDSGTGGITRSAYEQRIHDKTASLFATAAEGGAILGGVDEDGIALLRAYGYNVGMAYQVKDDILDFESTPETLGKPAGRDLPAGIVTLPVILLHERSQGADAVSELVANPGEAGPELLERAVEEVRSSGILEEARSVVDTYVAAASNALMRFPRSAERDSLIAIARFAVERDY